MQIIFALRYCEKPAGRENYRLNAGRKVFNSLEYKSLKKFSIKNFQHLKIFISPPVNKNP